MKPQLVPDWKRAWRWLSVHALAITGALPGIWISLPADWRAAVPAGWLAVVTLITAGMGVYGRLIDQTPKPDDTDRAGA